MEVKPLSSTGNLVDWHNTLNLKRRIPREILSQIFCILRDDGLYDYNEYPGHPHVLRAIKPAKLGNDLSWMAVTAVCSEWRFIALDNSYLWDEIDIRPNNAPLINFMLLRSQLHPLHISIHECCPEDIQQPLATTLYRTTELRLVSSTGSPLGKAIPLNYPIPLLKKFIFVGHLGTAPELRRSRHLMRLSKTSTPISLTTALSLQEVLVTHVELD
jgi:hypothetical protein